MSGHQDRLEAQRVADMYQVTRPIEAPPAPLWPRLKRAAEWWGIGGMVSWVGKGLWPF